MAGRKKKQKEVSKLRRFFDTLMWVTLGFILTLQVLALIGVSMSEVKAIKAAKGLIPAWIVAIYFIGMAILLCRMWKRKEKLSLVPMTLGIVGAVLALVVALTLRAALPPIAAGTNVRDGGLQGLNGWRLFWRHYTPIIVGAVTAIVSFTHYKSLRDDRIRKENEAYKETFNFDADNPLLAKDEDESKGKKKSKKERKAEKE